MGNVREIFDVPGAIKRLESLDSEQLERLERHAVGVIEDRFSCKYYGIDYNNIPETIQEVMARIAVREGYFGRTKYPQEIPSRQNAICLAKSCRMVSSRH
jgi:hypothetical protein